jgi:signal transduction histidine kinase/Tfp pilus assembly protein PilF
MMQRSALLAFLLLAFTCVQAQRGTTTGRVDSIKAALPALKDTARINALLQLCMELDIRQPVPATQYAQEALELSRKLHYRKGEGWAQTRLGRILYVQGNYTTALERSLRALLIFEELKDDRGEAFALNSMGIIFNNLGDYNTAREYHKRTLAVRLRIGDENGIFGSLNNIGVSYHKQKQYDSAITYFTKALEHPKGLLQYAYNNLGDVHLDLKDYPKAQRYYEQSMTIARNRNDKRMECRNLFGYGAVALAQSRFAEAETQLLQSLAIAQTQGFKPYERDLYHLLAVLKAKTGNYTMAYQYRNKEIAMADSQLTEENRRRLSEVEGTLASYRQQIEIASLNKKREEDSVFRNYLFGIIAVAAGGLLVAAFAYRQKRRDNQLLQTQKLAIEQQNNEIQQMNAELNAQKEELQVSNDFLDQTLKELKNAQQQLILQEKMTSLGAFINNVAHELNTPLGAVRSSSQMLNAMLPEMIDGLPKALSGMSEEGRTFFATMLQHERTGTLVLNTKEERDLRQALQQQVQAHGLHFDEDVPRKLVNMGYTQLAQIPLKWLQLPDTAHIIDQAAKFSAVYASLRNIDQATEKTRKIVYVLKVMEGRHVADELKPVDLRTSVEATLGAHAHSFGQAITLHKELAMGLQLKANPEELAMVWGNIVLNAIQAMGGKGTLHVSLAAGGHEAVINFTNNGPVIKPEEQGKIFDPFYTTKPRGEGSGLGLHVCKRIVEQYGGTITVQSDAHQTVFTVRLPLGR